MARIHELIHQVAANSDELAREIKREVDILLDRRAFGLNFERHTPEEVELPGRPVRHGDKVHVLPPRGEDPAAENRVVWVVDSIDTSASTVSLARAVSNDKRATREVALEDVVVVAEFRDPIYPGLVLTSVVERGGDRPFHSVINGENFHALQTLLFTHRGRVDAIYIDPPYNTGAKDWKYNNDYVAEEDAYRHSKWLAFMERRLLLAKDLLNPDDSILMVAIDGNEYLRLGLLLEQVFPGAKMTMVSTITNPKGVVVRGDFARANEYVFFLQIGHAEIDRQPEYWTESDDSVAHEEAPEPQYVTWQSLRRSDIDSARHGARYSPNQFYPIYVHRVTGVIEEIGEPLAREVDRATAPERPGCDTVFPIRPDGTEIIWGVVPSTLRGLLAEGFVTAGNREADKPQTWSVKYITRGKAQHIREGKAVVVDRRPDGSVIAAYSEPVTKMPTNQWSHQSHNAQHYGTILNQALIPGRRFPFPKALYAVEDCLRLAVGDKPHAVIVDFFAGSGTTAHAVMRLNRQDGGRRTSISITNNEVSADEQTALRGEGLRPGDPAWEQWGICEFITKPRLSAAATGLTPEGAAIEGAYKFVDRFPMADGFSENLAFFTLTYESPLRVASNRAFARVAPMLWMRAGAMGARIDSLPDGWAVAEAYGVIQDLDKVDAFRSAILSAPDVACVFIITDEDRAFEAVVRTLPDHVEPVRLYDAYLRNFEIEIGRAAL